MRLYSALITAPAGARVASVTYDDAAMIITRTLEYEDHTSTSIYDDMPSTRVEVERYTLESALEMLTDLDAAARSFVCEWYPELGYMVAQIALYRSYSYITFMQVGNEGLRAWLEWHDFTSVEAAENAGAWIIQDAAFTGYIIVSEV